MEPSIGAKVRAFAADLRRTLDVSQSAAISCLFRSVHLLDRNGMVRCGQPWCGAVASAKGGAGRGRVPRDVMADVNTMFAE
jgi:hypothetical protein